MKKTDHILNSSKILAGVSGSEVERSVSSWSWSSVTVTDKGIITVGQIRIPTGQVQLYTSLVDKFGEIVPQNLPNYKIEPINVALRGLLNSVEDMLHATPMTLSEKVVSKWKDMITFYMDMGLHVGWLLDHVCQSYRDWLSWSSELDRLEKGISAKQLLLEEKRKEIITLEKELEELCAELKTAHIAQPLSKFSFLD